MIVRLRRDAFDRWIVLHPELDDAAWSGQRWTSISRDGFPNGDYYVSNFNSEKEAAKYAEKCGFQTSFFEETGH